MYFWQKHTEEKQENQNYAVYIVLRTNGNQQVSTDGRMQNNDLHGLSFWRRRWLNCKDRMPIKKQYAIYIIQAICDEQWGIRVEGTIITTHTLYLQQISFKTHTHSGTIHPMDTGNTEISTMQTIHTT